MRQLFRDYIFHQVDERGRPVLDLSHVLTCLNKLDAGVDERVTLTSRDSQSCLVVSYREVRPIASERALIVYRSRTSSTRPSRASPSDRLDGTADARRDSIFSAPAQPLGRSSRVHHCIHAKESCVLWRIAHSNDRAIEPRGRALHVVGSRLSPHGFASSARAGLADDGPRLDCVRERRSRATRNVVGNSTA